MPTFRQKAWVVTVDMGYGHQRATFPLQHLAQGGVIVANNYPGIPDKDKNLWHSSRKFYEFISRFKKVPVLGEKAFELFDRLQAIPEFYPRRDLSRPNLQVREIYTLFEKFDWGKHLITRLNRRPLPLVTAFFSVAMMAEYFNYEGEIYCVVCDADVARAWAPLNPHTSRIIYLAPNRRAEDRLKLYGVRPSKIFLTGFPLPETNVGDNLKILKDDLGRRLIQLDPEKVFLTQYRKTLLTQLGASHLKLKPSRPVTITFAVGGAGAQRELGMTIVKSLKKDLLAKRVRINLVAGINSDVNDFFKEGIKALHLTTHLNKGLDIIFQKNKDDYFAEFNKILRTTDILWTKPSELSFYCALGLPIIMAPPIGSQEIFNQKWLQAIGAGMAQEDPRYVHEWLFDWLRSGWLAEAGMQGFMEAPKYGTYNIERIVAKRLHETKEVKSVLQY